MHFYWRIIEELRSLGEHVTFYDPNLMRCYKLWLERNADAISLMSEIKPPIERIFGTTGIPFSMN